MKSLSDGGCALLRLCHRPAKAGFSLLEISIVLVIVGLMTGYALQLNAAQSTSGCIEETSRQLASLRLAFDRYLITNNHYPLPAGRSLKSTDPTFGREAAGSGDSNIDRLPGPPALLIGGVPVIALGLSPDEGMDCWGNKFSYAVTETLTTHSGFANPANTGQIEIRNGPLASSAALMNNAAYVVLSHGADALGASPQNYSGPKRHCNSERANPAITRIDKENCDTTNHVFYTADYSNGDVPEYFFDDLLMYTGKPGVTVTTPPDSCAGGTISWGGNCSAPALITLAGLSVSLTNTNSGYTGVALSTCHNGVRTTLGTCLPIGTCSSTSPRGGPLVLLTGVGMNFGTGICKKYSCCSGTIYTNNLFPCPLIDLPGLASCP